VKRATHQCELN